MNKTMIPIISRAIALIFVLLLVTLSAYYLFNLIYPFIIGLILALLINPFVKFLEQKINIPRSLSVLITILLGIILILLFTTLLITEIIAGGNYLAQAIPKHITVLFNYLQNYTTQEILPLYNSLSTQFDNLDVTYQKTIIDNIEKFGEGIGGTISVSLENILKTIPVFLSKLPNIATTLIFSLLATFFISKDWHRHKANAKKLIPLNLKSTITNVVSNLKQALLGFVKAQLILISITTTIVLIGLIILQVEHAFTISIVIGLVDLLPYLGTGLIFVPWIIYSFLTGNISLGIGLSILYIIIVAQRQMAEPKVLSSNIGLDPLTTLLALFIGFQLFGVLGLIIGPVTLVILKTFYQSGVFHDMRDFVLNGTKNKSQQEQ